MAFKTLQVALLATTSAIILVGCGGATDSLEQAQKQPVFIPSANTEVNPATSLSYTTEKSALLINGDSASIVLSATNTLGGAAAGSQIVLDSSADGLELRGSNVVRTGEDGTVTANVTLVKNKRPYTVGQRVSINATLFTAGGTLVLNQNIPFVVSNSVDDATPSPTRDLSSYRLIITTNKSTVSRAGDSVTLTISSIDATGGVVKDVPIRLSSSNTGVRYLTPSNIITDDSGIATTTIITPSAGVTDSNFNVSATIAAGGIDYANSTTALNYAAIAAITGRLSATVEKTTLNINGDESDVSFQLSDTNGGSLPGIRIQLDNDVTDTGLGGLLFTSGSSLTTSSSGEANTTVKLISGDTGFITGNTTAIQATAFDSNGNQIASKIITFDVTSAVTATATVSPQVLLRGESSTMTVTVKDPQGNVVQNAKVNFAISLDASGLGVLSNTSALTNSKGEATTVYTAGAFTNKQIVKLTATLDPARYASVPVIEKTLNLTGVPAEILLNADPLKITTLGNIYYAKEFSLQVSDSEGQPVKNQTVSLSTDLIFGFKGAFCHLKTTAAGPDGIIPSTDDITNYNWGIAAFELGDLVANPENPSNIVNAAGDIINQLTTDNQGLVSFYVRFPKTYANWAVVDVKASAQLNNGAATAVSKTARYDLEAAASDVIKVAADNYGTNLLMRPNTISPYGSDYQGIICP